MLIVIRKKLLSFIIIFNTLLFLKHTFLDVAWCLCVCLSVGLSVTTTSTARRLRGSRCRSAHPHRPSRCSAELRQLVNTMHRSLRRCGCRYDHCSGLLLFFPPPLPLEVGPLKYNQEVWGSAVSSPSVIWGGVPVKIEFGAFLP